MGLAEVLRFFTSLFFSAPKLFSRCTVVFISQENAMCSWRHRWFFFYDKGKAFAGVSSHNNIYVWSPLAWKVWCNYIWNIGEPPPWRGLKEELTAWAWQLVDNLQPPTVFLMAPSDASQLKTVSQGKRGHCNQTRASASKRQRIKYEWSADQPANVFVHK